jgi:predicted MFS family arabinose efflux permease
MASSWSHSAVARKIGDMNSQKSLSAGLVALLSFSTCLILDNIYYAQPVLTDIAGSLGLSISQCGLIVTAVQIGYFFGMLFIAPLGDSIENRKLIVSMIFCAGIALFIAASIRQLPVFLFATFFIGLFSTATQVVVAFATTLASDHERGKIMGLVVAGLLAGMVLARPVSSLVTGAFGWRTMYFIASALMLILSVSLFRLLPKRAPLSKGIRYVAMLKSMGKLLVTVPRLRSRFFLSSIAFMSVMIFWTTAPIALRANLNFSHAQVALFTLAGLISPPLVVLAGRWIDHGIGKKLIYLGAVMVLVGFALPVGFGLYAMSFLFGALLLDPGVNFCTLTVQQSAIALSSEARARLNSLNVSVNFIGGSLGSALGPWIFHHFGWNAVALTGIGLMIVVLGVNATLGDAFEKKR